jgi:DNA-binding MurR/RpiR family transcriptional regulator
MTSKKQQEKRKQRRVQLEFDEDVKEAIRDLSAELGVSQSQIVQFFILTGLQDFNAGKSALSRYLEPSDAPMWQYRINFERLKRDLGYE